MLQRLNIGQRITTFPGGTLNALIDDYNARHSERRRISEKSPTVISQPPSSVLVRLVWVGDETPLSGGEVIVEAGSVVALGDVFDTPADNGSVPYNGLVFACNAPTSENAASCHFAILATPLHVPTSGAKSVAIGYIPNAAWAKLTINDAADEAADLVDGSTLLSSASGGRVPIVWKETGTGVKWAVVALQAAAVDLIIGQATSTTSGATFAIDGIERITPGALPSEPLTVNNTLGLDITDNQWVFAAKAVDGDWETWTAGEEGPPGDGALFADFTATARSDRATDTITGDIDQYWGGTPVSTTGVTVHKLSDHDVTIEDGDKFRAGWDSDDEEWKLFWFSGLRLVVKGTVAGTRVTASTTDFTLATPTLINGWRLPTATITVTNTPPIDAEVGAVVYARHNLSIGTDPLENWDTGDGGNFLWKLRGVGSYNEGVTQVVVQDANDNPEWTEAEEIDVITEITSLAITGGNLVLTFKKGTFKVIKEVTAPASDTVTIAVTECE